MYYFFKENISGKFVNLERDVNLMIIYILSKKRAGENIDWKIYTTGSKIVALFKDFQDKFDALSNAHKRKVLEAYSCNRKIERICNSKVTPVPYTELDTSVKNSLAKLENYLYDDLFNLKNLKTSKLEHYNDIVKNLPVESYTCPFCGIENLETEFSGIRDDFDHYLLKSKYPFTSINTINLVPMCKKCNQSYKKQSDISSMDEVFFPFNKNVISFDVSYDGVLMEATNDVFRNQIFSWDSIFNLFKRSSDQIKVRGAIWFENDIEAIHQKYDIDIDELLSESVHEMSSNIFEMRHLKAAYFEHLLKTRR